MHVLLKVQIASEPDQVWAYCECGALLCQGPILAASLSLWTKEIGEIHRAHVRTRLGCGEPKISLPTGFARCEQTLRWL